MQRDVSSLDGREFDVLVVGAGINGASAAQHLAASGYSVLLADKGDFGAGTTSRSSRLLHCGARYFVPGRSMAEFFLSPRKGATALKMARAAMQMRAQMKRTTGERLRQFNWCYPIYRDGRYKAWQFDAAFRLLAALGPSDVPLGYRRLTAPEALQSPLLEWQHDPKKLVGAALMQEFQYHWPERIVVDAVLDARRLGAEVWNYTKVENLAQTGDGGWEARLEDAVTEHSARVSAKMLVNTAGIWIDKVNALATDKAQRKIHGTKGVHIAVRLPPECQGWATVNYSTDDEPLFCAPFNGFHYMGPSEVNFSGDPDDIAPTEEDIELMVFETNRVLPGMGLTRKDVLFAWAGVRPLTFGGAAYPKGNRLRVLHDLGDEGMRNAVALTGGVIMTHRSAAEEIVAAVRKRVPPSRKPAALSYAAKTYPENQNAAPLLAEDTSIKLSDLRFAAEEELPQTLSDLLFRRVPAGYTSNMARAEARRAAETVAGSMGWDEDEIDRQVAAYQAEVAHLFKPAAMEAQP